jgi:hypothetical protein
LSKINQKKDKNGEFLRNFKEKSTPIWITVVIVLAAVVLFFDGFWSFINTGSNSIQGYYIFDTCSVRDFESCTFIVKGNDALLTIKPNIYPLEKIDFTVCSNYVIEADNTVRLSNCSFSPRWNQLDIKIYYKNPESGLVHQDIIRVTKSFEITKVAELGSEGADKITGMWNDFSINSKS